MEGNKNRRLENGMKGEKRKKNGRKGKEKSGRNGNLMENLIFQNDLYHFISLINKIYPSY